MLLNKVLPVSDSYCSLCYMIRVNMEVFSDVTSPHLPNSRAWRAAKYISVCLKCPSPLWPASSTSPPLFFSWCFVWDRLHLVSRVFPLGTNHSLYHAGEYIDVLSSSRDCMSLVPLIPHDLQQSALFLTR